MKKKTIFILIILIFVFFQLKLFNPMLSDENVYFYYGKLILDGEVPYKDFFFAHPPVQIYIFAALFQLFGIHFYIVKIVSLLSALIIALLLYKLSDSNIAPLLYLGSVTVFYTTTFNYGVNLTAMLCVLGYYLFKKEKYVLSGAILGLAITTGIYALGVIIPMFLLIKNKHQLNTFGWCLTVVLGIHIAFFKVAGMNFLNQVYFYHTVKESILSFNSFLITAFMADYMLYTLLGIGTVFLIRDRFKQGELFLISVPYILFMAALSLPLRHYLVIVIPYMVLVGVKVIKSIRWDIVQWCIVFFIVMGALGNMTYIDNYNKLNRFYSSNEVVEWFSNKENASIFGDNDIAPLVALMSGHEFTHSQYIDSYPFSILVLNTTRFAQELMIQKPMYILIVEIDKTINPLWKNNNINSVLKHRCNFGWTPLKEWRDYRNRYIIYRCVWD